MLGAGCESGFTETPDVTASRGSQAGRGEVSPSGEGSLDTPRCATQSQFYRVIQGLCVTLGFGQLRVSLQAKYRGLPCQLRVLKFEATPAKMFGLVENSAVSNTSPLLAGAPHRPAGS